MWNILLAVALGIHGLIHILAPLAYFKLVEMNDIPYKTTLLARRWDIGDKGIRTFGIVWFLIMIGYMAGAIGVAFDQNWWYAVTMTMTAISLVVCILDVPAAQFGVIINVVLLILLIIGPNIGWFEGRINF